MTPSNADELSAVKPGRGSILARARQSPLWRLETALFSGAVILGLGSAALSEANRDASNREVIERYRVKKVLVAAKDLPPGSKLDPESVTYGTALVSSLTPNFADEDTLDGILGRSVAIEFKERDPILLSGVEGFSINDSFAAKIPTGRRLVTLQIADRVAQKGWIKPNDHVDVIATMELPGRGRTTFTLLSDVTLVSVGKANVWTSGQVSEGTEIGFYATPRDVEFISFAERSGTFSLALRNPQDVAKHQGPQELGADGIDMNKFLDHSSISKASGGGDLPIFIDGKKAERESR